EVSKVQPLPVSQDVPEVRVAVKQAQRVHQRDVIRIELQRGAMAITVTWPAGAASDCATWLRELLR
ncbi:hypothetical protein, partial [Chromohalobacter sp. HP20-39]|uniref:hypothetical protein n=1 Tax=Chromohalobacter sp. HP20-39 TaxID=3079306 RepID=UPI00294B397F